MARQTIPYAAYKGIIPARGLKLLNIFIRSFRMMIPYKGIIPARGLKLSAEVQQVNPFNAESYKGIIPARGLKQALRLEPKCLDYVFL